MKRRFKTVISLILVVVMGSVLLAGCKKEEKAPTQQEKAQNAKEETAEQGKETEEVTYDPFEKYEPGITVSAGRILTSWMKFDEGEDLDNNWWMRTFKDQLGIQVEWKWTANNWGEPYESRINTSMAVNDLPDMMNVYGSIFARLVENDQLIDLTEAYEKYASPELRKVMEANDKMILKGGMVDGKLFGIGLPSGFNLNAPAVLIRKDWLEKVGKTEPKNLMELEEIALAFVNEDPDGNGKKDTYGVVFDNDLNSLRGLMMAFGAVDEGWVVNDGEVQPGRIQPEMKDAWNFLADWYQKGIISSEFAIKSINEEARQDIISGKVGIKISNFSDFDAPEFKDQHMLNPDSDWIAVPLTDMDGNLVKSYTRSKVQDFNVVTKKCENPEAAIKMLNLMLQVYSNEKPEFVDSFDYHVTSEGSLSFFMAPFRMQPSNAERVAHLPALKALRGEIEADSLSFESRDIYDKVVKYEETKDPELWGYWKKFKLDGSFETGWTIIENNPDLLYIDPVNWTETPADGEFGNDLNSRYKEFATLAIMENDVDKYFDIWIKYFNNNGGLEILEQNNAIYK